LTRLPLALPLKIANMNFEEIASVSGKSGLFKVLKPTRTGMILESLSDQKKMVVGMHTKVSVLADISIYTTDGDGSVPLQEVMGKIHQEFEGDTGLSASSDPDELKSFLKFILPDYDEERVYISDIKKLVTWYNQLAELAPELFNKEEQEKENTGNTNNEEA
jgi:hypothetical protein